MLKAMQLTDVFPDFQIMGLKVYELDPARFLNAQGLIWQAALKNTKVILELLTNIDVLLMVEKGIKGGLSHAFYRCVKASNKYMKNYIKIKNFYILNIGM